MTVTEGPPHAEPGAGPPAGHCLAQPSTRVHLHTEGELTGDVRGGEDAQLPDEELPGRGELEHEVLAGPVAQQPALLRQGEGEHQGGERGGADCLQLEFAVLGLAELQCGAGGRGCTPPPLIGSNLLQRRYDM